LQAVVVAAVHRLWEMLGLAGVAVVIAQELIL
jgi:hypothetical protein